MISLTNSDFWLFRLQPVLVPLEVQEFPLPCGKEVFQLKVGRQSCLPRIHRRTALGTALEEARGCSSESGIMVLKQKTGPRKGAPDRCYHVTTPTASQIAFDDHRLVANAGLILPATLALRLGLPQLLRKHLDLGGAPGRANTGDKMMTLVASALAGGDCIDDADVLRAGGTARVLGFHG